MPPPREYPTNANLPESLPVHERVDEQSTMRI
jgi:hypothetical protein